MIIILNRYEPGDVGDVEQDDDDLGDFRFEFIMRGFDYVKRYSCHIELQPTGSDFVLTFPEDVELPSQRWIKDYLDSKFWSEVTACPDCGYSTDTASAEGEW